MERVLIVSADCHAGIPFDDYRPYIEQRHLADFDYYKHTLDAYWERVSGPFSDETNARRAEVAHRVDFYDSQARLADLESNGVVAEVLFPSASEDTHTPWSDFLTASTWRSRTPRQRELTWAGERAYNRWLGEFCQDVPDGRRIGLAYLPYFDVDEAVREIHWAADNGFRGILLPLFQYDVPEYCQAWYWDRIWAACAEAGMSLNLHGGYGEPEFGRYKQMFSMERLFWSQRPLSHLILSGVFDRFPNLGFTITESLSSWIPDALAKMDEVWDTAHAGMSVTQLSAPTLDGIDDVLCKRRPSEYWSEIGFCGVSVTNLAEMQLRYEIGLTSMMWGIDYPHPEGAWGQAMEWFQASLGNAGVTPDEARLILGENAARLYHLDLDALRPIADRIGPSMDDVLQRASDDKVDDLLKGAVDSGREMAATIFAANMRGHLDR